MKQSINVYQFEQAFRDYDRYDNFGYQGLSILFDYLEQLEDDIGEEIELDVIAICCDYNMLTFDEIYSEYIYSESCGNKHIYDEEAHEDLAHLDAEGQEQYLLDWLEYHTCVVGVTDDKEVIFQVF